jgi:hypothetical protein
LNVVPMEVAGKHRFALGMGHHSGPVRSPHGRW